MLPADLTTRLRRWALSLVLGYIALGLIWIHFSDRVVEAVVPLSAQPIVQTYKGAGYVVMTGLLLWILLSRLRHTLIQSEELRTRSRTRFIALFDSPIVGLLRWGEAGSILECNRALCDLLGREIDSSVSWPELSTEASAAKLRALNIVANENGSAGPISIELLRGNGQPIAVLAGLVRFPDEPWGGVAFVIDDRERQAAIENYERLNIELESRVETRTAELAYANEELRSFAYTISHDLRSPLRTIDGLASRIAADEPALAESSRQALDRMHVAIVRTTKIIDHVLDLATVSRAELHRDPIDVTLLVQSIAEELHARPGYERVSCVVEPGLTTVGDPRLLHLAFQNLLENAYKFSSTQDLPEVRVFKEAERIVFSDNGVGFDPLGKTQLFEPFRRLHGEEFPGSGVGLSTVDTIIRRHGGEISADSKPGQGARFSVYLPKV